MATRPATKALLLSAFAFPGAGQLYLKRWPMAAVLIVISTVALVVLLIDAVSVANGLAQRLVDGELALDAGLLAEVSAASAEVSASSTPATIALAATWLIGIVHTCFATRSSSTPRAG